MNCCTNLSCSCCESTSIEHFSQVCPICKHQGMLVKNFTVKHIVLDEYLSQVGNEDYFLCTNPECDVGYYKGENVFYKYQLKVPIWLKKECKSQVCMLLWQGYRRRYYGCCFEKRCKNFQ